MSHPVFDTIRAAAAKMDNLTAIDYYAATASLGIAFDDPSRTHVGCIAIWYGGGLYALHLADVYAAANPGEASTVITSVIYQAQDNAAAAGAAARRRAEQLSADGLDATQIRAAADQYMAEIAASLP